MKFKLPISILICCPASSPRSKSKLAKEQSDNARVNWTLVFAI